MFPNIKRAFASAVMAGMALGAPAAAMASDDIDADTADRSENEYFGDWEYSGDNGARAIIRIEECRNNLEEVCGTVVEASPEAVAELSDALNLRFDNQKSIIGQVLLGELQPDGTGKLDKGRILLAGDSLAGAAKITVEKDQAGGLQVIGTVKKGWFEFSSDPLDLNPVGRDGPVLADNQSGPPKIPG